MSRHDEDTQNALLKTLLKGAGIVIFGTMISKVISYAYRIFIARYFGPSEYGIFSLGMAVVGCISTIVLLGLSVGVTRFIAFYASKNDKEAVKGVITSSLQVVLILSAVAAVALFISSPFIATAIFHEETLTPILQVLSVYLPFSAMILILMAAFAGFRRMDYKVLTESIVQNVSRIIFVLLFVAFGFGILGAAWAWTFAAALTCAAALVFMRREFPVLGGKLKARPLKMELIKYSSPLLLAEMMGIVVMWTSTLVLGIYASSADVGIYNASLPTAQLLFVAPLALTSLFLPIITMLHARGKEIRPVYKTVTRWIFYINFPFFLILAFFSAQILNVLFGPEYIPGSLALILLSVGFMINKGIAPAINLLETLKKTKLIMYITGTNTVLNLALNFMLVPSYGMMGAATATMATYLLSFVLFLAASYRITGIFPYSRDILKSIAAGTIAVLAVSGAARLLFTDFGIVLLGLLFLLFFVLYLSLLVLFKGVRKDDVEMLRSIEKKTGLRIKFLRNIVKRFA